MSARRLRLAWMPALVLAGVALTPVSVAAGGPLACGDTIATDTTLTSDLDCSAADSTGIIFGADGITLDLGGHTLDGPDGIDTHSGVDTNGHMNVTVRNGQIIHWGTGVAVTGSVGATISAISFVGQGGQGTAVAVDSGERNVITGNQVKRVRTGIRLYVSLYNKVTWNTVRNATSESIYAEGEIQDTIAHNTSEGSGGNRGAYDVDSYSQRYRYNTFSGGAAGLYATCRGTITVKNNTARDNSGDGFYLLGCADNAYHGAKVSGNTAIHNGGYGFFTGESAAELWTGNLAKRNGSGGFYLFEPSLGTFTGNTAIHNDADGFTLADNAAELNVQDFSENTANDNNGYGFVADAGTPSSDNHADGNVSGDCYNVDCN